MDIAFLVVSGLVAVFFVAVIACPEKICPDHPMVKKKRVGSSYWGVYENADPEKSVGSVEVEPLVGKHKSVYGAASYAQGKGVSRRGA